MMARSTLRSKPATPALTLLPDGISRWLTYVLVLSIALSFPLIASFMAWIVIHQNDASPQPPPPITYIQTPAVAGGDARVCIGDKLIFTGNLIVDAPPGTPQDEPQFVEGLRTFHEVTADAPRTIGTDAVTLPEIPVRTNMLPGERIARIPIAIPRTMPPGLHQVFVTLRGSATRSTGYRVPFVAVECNGSADAQ